MDVDWDLMLRIIIPFGTLIAGVFLRVRLEKRSNVVFYIGTESDFAIRNDGGQSESAKEKDDPDSKDTNKTSSVTGVYTHSLVISNNGRASAKNLRVGHVILPEHFFVSPKVDYEIKAIPDSGSDMVFPILRPNETVTVSYLYFQRVGANQIHTYLKSDEGFAKGIPVFQTRLYPKWVRISLLIASVSGFIAWIYVLVILSRKFF
jgi:hypothetical protein